MNAKEVARIALHDATALGMTVKEARFGVALRLGLHGHSTPDDILSFASGGRYSDDDIAGVDWVMPVAQWTERKSTFS